MRMILPDGSAVVGGLDNGDGAIWYLQLIDGTWQFVSIAFTPPDAPRRFDVWLERQSERRGSGFKGVNALRRHAGAASRLRR